MNKSINVAVCLLTLLCLSACQSTPRQDAKTASASADTAAIAAKQQEYDQMLQEWKTLKPGLERMLAIEEEMNLLIGQLELLKSVTQAPSNPAPAPAPKKTPASVPSQVVAPVETAKIIPTLPAPAPAPAPAPSEVQATSHGAANYSLQVASLTELKLLPKKWKQMQSKYPQLMANLEPNYQTIQVNNTTYYRLKIGAFSSAQEANQKCAELIAAGISCLPVKYTESNFSQIEQ